jgi:regulator of protease activity HflC (stomatin/prohibitin superfamily)
MAEKRKKAYQRFAELTGQATAPIPAEADAAGIEHSSAEAITIRLRPEVRRALVRRVNADNTTPSEIIEEALRRYLEIPR